MRTWQAYFRVRDTCVSFGGSYPESVNTVQRHLLFDNNTAMPYLMEQHITVDVSRPRRLHPFSSANITGRSAARERRRLAAAKATATSTDTSTSSPLR